MNTCKTTACARPANGARGFCWSCYARQRRAGAFPHRKLSEDSVRTIRRRAKAGERYRVLADEFNISQAMVSHIRNGKCHKGVA